MFFISVPPNPLLVDISQTGSGVAGDNYTLTCTVTENIDGLTGSPTVQWMGLSGNVVKDSSSTGDQTSSLTLTFSPLLTSHGGDGYTCEGTAMGGNITANLSLNLTVASKPVCCVEPVYFASTHML